MRKRSHLLAGLAIFFISPLVFAAPTTITPTNGFGTTVSPGFLIQGGKLVGGNLFHSFSTFNLGTGNTADFIVAGGGVTNIFARVTGGPSTIDGTITSSLGINGPLSKANLFFINPEGVMFTSNAEINLGGSFIVSTANYVKFSDGSKFFADTNHPINDEGLSSAPVSAFGFVTSTTQPSISFNGSTLTAPEGQGIHVLGGDVFLNGAELLAPSGYVSIFSAASNGEVPFNLNSPGSGFSAATNTSFGNINLTNSSKLAIDGPGGGKIVIRGGQLVVDNSTFSSANSGSVAGGDISVEAVQATIQNSSSIVTSTSGSGSGGNITATVRQATVQDSGLIQASTSGTGSTGNVNAQVVNLLTINGGKIGDTSTSLGSAGNVTVQTGSLAMTGNGIIYSESLGTSGDSVGGDSGLVSITSAGNISLTSGGEISSRSYTTGNAGNVTVQARSLFINGSQSGIFSGSDGGLYSNGLGGSGGAVSVKVGGNITITSDGEISSTTFTSGNAGGVTLQAGSLSIDGSGSGIFSESVGAQDPYGNYFGGPGGTAGAVIINVGGTLSVSNGGVISSVSFTSGNAGSLTVQAGSLSINGSGSGIFSATVGPDGGGTGGEGGVVSVSAGGNVSITNGGEISTSTYTTGNAGDVYLDAGSLSIDGSGSGIYLESVGYYPDSPAGSAGAVSVNVAGTISLTNGGAISTSTFYTAGNAGNVTVEAGALSIDGLGSGILSDSVGAQDSLGSGNSGGVNVDVGGNISLTGGGEISSTTYATGNAGNVTVQAGSLSIDGIPSGIFSQSAGTDLAGPGGTAGTVSLIVAGNISLTHAGVISSGTFTAGNAGDVIVQANQVDLDDGSIDSESQGLGAGGSVMITANNVELRDNSLVSSSSLISNGGSVEMNVGDTLALYSGSGISTSSANNGGNITLKVGNLVYLLDSQISAAAGDNGGNILIDPEFVVLDNSKITANAGAGQGGNITIITDYYLNEDSQITATGATSGTITISAPDLDLGAAMVGLPDALEIAEKRLKERCAISIRYEFSTLTVVGRGGTEPVPEELQSDFGVYSGSYGTVR